jgi:hypothetical protein
MAEIKTKKNSASVEDFINAVPDEKKREDSLELLRMFKEVTGESPSMWGTSIVGYGLYHYKSEKSSQEGDWPLAGFSPRKQNLTIYIMNGTDNYKELFIKLGKYKTSVGCLYISKLSDVDVKVLGKIIKASYTDSKRKFNGEG